MTKKQIRKLAETIAFETELFAGIDLADVARKWAKQETDDYIAHNNLTLSANDRAALIYDVYKVTAEADLESVAVSI